MTAFSDAGYANRGSTGYRPDAGSRSNRPSGPDQVAQYSGIRPNGQYPNVGVTGGLYGLGRSIFTGDAYGQYGEPDMPAADISTRDSTMGSLRGNTGWRDAMGIPGMAGGSTMAGWMQNAINGLRLRGVGDQQLNAWGLLPTSMMAPQPGMMGPQPQQQPPNPLMPQVMPAKQLSVGGPTLPAYGAAVPSYGYFK